MAGADQVQMVLTSEGRLRPRLRRQLDEDTNKRIMSVCPGRTLTGPSQSQLVGSARGVMHPVFGPLRAWYRGWAADESVRWRAAAGGSLTTLAGFLLDTGRVQKVLHVRASKKDPTQTVAQVSTTSNEVASGCQSRYGPAAPLVHVCQLLDEGLIFAVVAKPCDIAAIRALAKIDDRVRSQIPYLLSIFCGGLPSRNAALKIAKHHGVEPHDIGTCRYRGHGWPGLMTMGQKSSGKEYGTTYNETWKWSASPLGPDAGITKYDLQWRCKICPDAVGELADVSCPDGWLYDPKEKRYVSVDGDDPGQNLVLARTACGEALVQDCIEASKLVVAPLEISELEAMHFDHYPRKCSWPMRILATWFFRRPARLSVVNYRPWLAIFTAGIWTSWEVFRGTWKRLVHGADLESLA
eukprot:TRINITY_DN107383_c0_g1_i1.p1 TRINITY_DN107383_c0_g1~~TRINITY_DN107383_c0_g1_i1.p1  ORF type:complete len:439 (-),score=45.30 TRINITY_DN107383_c0_g1_i1:55-1281(-)